MAISFSVNCERAVLFPVKCDLDPPLTTLIFYLWQDTVHNMSFNIMAVEKGGGGGGDREGSLGDSNGHRKTEDYSIYLI